MNFAFLIVTILMFFLNSAIANENKAHLVRINLAPENVLVMEEGICVSTKNSGEVAIGNIQHDENGFYTLCPVRFKCIGCDLENALLSETCPCGSKNFSFKSAGNKKASQYFVEELISNLIYQTSILAVEVIPCGSLIVDASADNEGNTKASAYVKDSREFEKSKVEYGGGFIIEKNEDGKVSVKAEVKGEWKF